jgi:MerR family transcriptional regulator, copper efflux regulator
MGIVRHLPIAVPDPPGSGEVNAEALLQVGDLAKAAGKTVRAIHLYEELGLLRPHARSKGRYRLFGEDSLVRVRWIGKLQDLGLSLTDIQGIVREWETAPSAPGAMRLMRDTYRTRLAETRAQIARLRALENELAASLEYLDTCHTCDPARLIHACTRCDLHSCEQHAPDLVAGFHAGKSTASEG